MGRRESFDTFVTGQGMVVGITGARSVADEIRDRHQRGGNAGSAWADMPLNTRTIVCMLSPSTGDGDPREFARRPWASYTSAQQIELGATARELHRSTAQAGALR